MDETYEEEDVFFGPITNKESGKIKVFANRRTRYLGQARIQGNDASVDPQNIENVQSVSENEQNSDSKISLNTEEDSEESSKDTQFEGETRPNSIRNNNSEIEEIIDRNINLRMKPDEKYEEHEDQDMCEIDNAAENVELNEDCIDSATNNSSPMCVLGYKDFDLNENNGTDSKNLSTLCNDNTVNEFSPNESQSSEILQEEGDKISELTFHLKNSFALQEKDSEENNLNKLDSHTLKRESYFTSLEVINVHQMSDSINSDIENLSFEHVEQMENMEIDNDSKDDNVLSLEGSSCDIANKGLLLSHSLSSTSVGDAQSDRDENLMNINLKQRLSNMKDLSINNENCSFISPSSNSSCPPSPERRFNDTIEEMELLLARGIDYYKDIRVSEESILEPPKEQTISSTHSINSFNPNFDSTHASSGDTSKEKAHKQLQDKSLEELEENIQMALITEVKRVPPEKPPRVIITPSTPKPHFAQLNSCKAQIVGRTDKTNMHSPIVKTITKSNIENFTPKYTSALKSSQEHLGSSSTKTLPCTTPRSFHNKNMSNFNTPTSSKVLKINTPSTPKYCNRYPLSKSASKSKIPRLTPPENKHVFSTPQPVIPNKIKSAVGISRHKTIRALNIVSPVMKYLQDNPPPPLITNVKPRYKLSPSTLSKVARANPMKPELLMKINDAGQNNAQETSKFPLKEINAIEATGFQGDLAATVLPPSVYKQGESIKVNKENVNINKRTIPSDGPPIFILKHTGRMKVRKEVMQNIDFDKSSSLERFKHEAEASRGTPPGRDSLMEVSVYEQHSVRRANTLK